MHRDSLGVEQAIKPGEVNWMTGVYRERGLDVHDRRRATTQYPVLIAVQTGN